jgi:hypothetical protein
LHIYNGTNPKVLVDFNDGSPFLFSKQRYLSFNHTFPGCGYYDVNITVYNLVSLISKTIPVS